MPTPAKGLCQIVFVCRFVVSACLVRTDMPFIVEGNYLTMHQKIVIILYSPLRFDIYVVCRIINSEIFQTQPQGRVILEKKCCMSCCPTTLKIKSNHCSGFIAALSAPVLNSLMTRRRVTFTAKCFHFEGEGVFL